MIVNSSTIKTWYGWLVPSVFTSWLSVSVLMFSTVVYSGECLPIGGVSELAPVSIDSVVDGDTVVLGDGRTVRLVGINTPEMAIAESRAGYDWQRQTQPQAQEAKEALIQLVADADVRLYPSVSGKDRYRRTLAHLFTDNDNLTAMLLRRGLGFAIAVAPDLIFTDCYVAAEKFARNRQVGVWIEEQLQPISALRYDDNGRTGFALIYGMVTKVSKGKGRVWLDIDDSVSVMIGKRHLKYFLNPIERHEGQNVELRGWVIDRQKPGKRLASYKKRWLVSVTHPTMLRILLPENNDN